MDLLPKTHQDFSSSSYWETFFKKRGTKAFEWYGEYSTFCGLLAKYIKTNDKILITGCGNSDMSAQMYDFGYKNLTSIDISANVIQQMKQKNAKTRPDLKFLEMDLFNTTFEDEAFSVVLDKGTLDAIYCEDTEENAEKVDRMFKEISRLLRLGGRYVCISLAQQFIAQKIVNYFSDEGWLTRVCVVQNDNINDGADDDPETNDKDKLSFSLPVFIFVLTKFKKFPNTKPIFETSYFDDKIERVSSPEAVLSSISELQNYALVRQNLRQGNPIEDQLCVTLYNSSLSAPRYTIYIVDGKGGRAKKFAIFIVPQGRESEWMFSTEEGRKQLQKSCNYERLLVVLLNRFHEYSSLDLVKAELSSKVMQLAPSNIEKQSPFLTLGESISVRSKQFEGNSELSGGFVIEDVQIDNKLFRRLVFYSRPDVVQSEVMLRKAMKRGKKKSGKSMEVYEVDHSYLSCNYYAYVVAGIFFAQDFKTKLDQGMNIALIGLGGGSLAMYLHNTLVNARIKAVEIDKEITKVAEQWFDLKIDDGRIDLLVQDGVEFIENAKEKNEKYDIMIIDVDNKDTSLALSSPPMCFIDESFLQSCAHVMSHDGVYVLNLATRSCDSRNLVINRLKNHFRQIYCSQVDENINEILYCLPKNVDHGCEEIDFVQVQDNVDKNFEEFKSRVNLIDERYTDSLIDFKLMNVKLV